MTMTVTQAIAQVRKYLDARDGTDDKWDDDDDIKPVIAAQLDRTVQDYLRANPTGHLTEAITVSAASGLADLSTYSPARIWAVYLASSGGNEWVEQVNNDSQWIRSPTTQALELRIVRRMVLPADDADPLVQVGTSALYVPGLERVICLRAAQELALEDRDAMPFVDDVLRGYEKTLFEHGGVNDVGVSAMDFTGFRGCQNEAYGWSYDHATQGLQLWRM